MLEFLLPFLDNNRENIAEIITRIIWNNLNKLCILDFR